MAVLRDATLPDALVDLINAQAAQIDRLTADVETLRADVVGLVQQLDADVGINDTDYEANHSPGAALTSDGYSMDTADN